MLGFGVGAFAMIVILSAFNGFEGLVAGLINNYDPDIEITSASKKVFVPDAQLLKKIRAIDDVNGISTSLEEKVVIKYNERQEIARIKGVGDGFAVEKFDSLVVIGEFDLGDSTLQRGVFGGGLSSKIGVFPGTQEPVSVLVPKRGVEYNSLNPMSALSIQYLKVAGVFIVHEEIDNEVFISSLDFAQRLLGYDNEVSAIEVNLKSGVDRSDFKEKLLESIGTQWKITTQEEQNELIYKIFKSEKWFTYAILSLVLLISAFNIFGSLIMLVLDKKMDISVLKAMGAKDGLIRRLFLWQGSYISMIGGGIGLLLGVLTVILQKRFGLLKLENSIVEDYPVELVSTDIFITLITVFVLGYIMSLYPANKAARSETIALN